MVWKFNNDRPVYQQIIEQLQAAVLAGDLEPGQRIPSVRDLAMQAGVNPNTMQHALREMESTGLLITEGTSGRFVTQDLQVLESLKAEQLRRLLQDCAKRFAAFGLTPAQAGQLLGQMEPERTDA